MEVLVGVAVLLVLLTVGLVRLSMRSVRRSAGTAVASPAERWREREAQELEEGAIDPDEAVDPAWWDEGADDEVR